jgi:lipoprotein-anchoring transpeptidase ErfK/SrfK
MKKTALVLSVCILGLLPAVGEAGERYKVRPPVIVSSNLADVWMTQLGTPRRVVRLPSGRVVAAVTTLPRTTSTKMAPQPMQEPVLQQQVQQPQMAPAATMQQVALTRPQQPAQSRMDPQFLPQEVDYPTDQKPGTIVIDTMQRFLYLVQGNGRAMRYGVGVGKPGFEWAGSHKITRKAEWPDWTPPSEMIAREAAKGHYLPARMDGGPENPLGARAMYLGNSLYRIHGTNAPWTIGYAVSSGCIRMRNQDVEDLYSRVKVGTKVIVM